jgi:hypothetical protein
MNKASFLRVTKTLAFFVLIFLLSGCSYRLMDFTVISSRSHSLLFDKAQGKKVEGTSLKFLGIGAKIKEAVDNALEQAGADYDLLLDVVVYQEDNFFVSGYRVTGTAVRSIELRAQLGEEGFKSWLETNNVFENKINVVDE